MTHEEFISIVKNPTSVSNKHIDDLKEMIGFYPYFVQPRLLLAKAAHDAKSIHAQKYVDRASMYCADRRWLFYYIHPEKNIEQRYKIERIPKYSGSYFDLVNTVEAEGGDTRQSLKNLAERLKLARVGAVAHVDINENAAVKPLASREPVHIPIPDYFGDKVQSTDANTQISDENLKKCIHEKKYAEAIEILKKLNLINPKKSIYFADQIRFLEKALVNSKK